MGKRWWTVGWVALGMVGIGCGVAPDPLPDGGFPPDEPPGPTVLRDGGVEDDDDVDDGVGDDDDRNVDRGDGNDRPHQTRCPQGPGPREAEWDCKPRKDVRLKVKAELEDGRVRLRVRGENIPANREVNVWLDAAGDGHFEHHLKTIASGTEKFEVERRFETCAGHLGRARARTDYCQLRVDD
jgi:hypothetical protein